MDYQSWRIRLKALPTLLVFYYRNLMSIPEDTTSKIMEVLLDCLADENVEVRDMASKMLSGVVRCSQRHSIPLLKVSHPKTIPAADPLRQHRTISWHLRERQGCPIDETLRMQNRCARYTHPSWGSVR